MNLPVVQEAVQRYSGFHGMRRWEVSSSVIRYSSKRERRLEGGREGGGGRGKEREKPLRERSDGKKETKNQDETSLTSRCERSVETEEDVKRWWRRQLKGDGDGRVGG